MQFVSSNQELVFWAIIIFIVGGAVIKVLSRILERIISLAFCVTAIIIIAIFFGFDVNNLKNTFSENINSGEVQTVIDNYFSFSQKVSAKLENLVTGYFENLEENTFKN